MSIDDIKLRVGLFLGQFTPATDGNYTQPMSIVLDKHIKAFADYIAGYNEPAIANEDDKYDYGFSLATRHARACLSIRKGNKMVTHLYGYQAEAVYGLLGEPATKPVTRKEYQHCQGSGCSTQFEVTSDTGFYCKDCQNSMKGTKYVD